MTTTTLTRAYYDLEDAIEILSKSGHTVTIKDLMHWGETRKLQFHIKARGESTAKSYVDTKTNGFQLTNAEPVYLYDFYRIDVTQISDILKNTPLNRLQNNTNENLVYIFDEPVLYTCNDILITAKDIHRLKNYLDKNSDTNKQKSLNITELLRQITPDLYDPKMKPKEKSAITKAINTIKEQLPEAFGLCCQLVMESMPCEGRDDFIIYTSDDVVERAAERGIKSPIARQIHANLPAGMKK